jgi:hypothetical protein
LSKCLGQVFGTLFSDPLWIQNPQAGLRIVSSTCLGQPIYLAIQKKKLLLQRFCLTQVQKLKTGALAVGFAPFVVVVKTKCRPTAVAEMEGAD